MINCFCENFEVKILTLTASKEKWVSLCIQGWSQDSCVINKVTQPNKSHNPTSQSINLEQQAKNAGSLCVVSHSAARNVLEEWSLWLRVELSKVSELQC